MPPPGLSPEELQAVSALLDEALELDPAARADWLDGLAARAPALHARLARLLELHARDAWTGLGAQGSAAAMWTGVSAPAAGLKAGDTVGPYRLLRELGAGGMASVWLADRIDGAFQRQVALKLPWLSRLRPELAERFARERDILARLEHPNIARFYDAGISHDGLPYLAMEFVEGQTLTAHCDSRRLPLADRVHVFQQVLDAIQYAHANLVIHRDLKPSNILVTGDGQVRVLDFGIAKLIDPEDRAAETELTKAAGRALTMVYASPEQLRGEPLSTASDLYTLGVVLYELLTGSRPYELPHDSAAQLESAILSTEPTRPGAALARAADAVERAQRRGSTPARLARELDGDLGSVLRKALAKAPGDRYDGCAALRDDLRRWLEGRPVGAQPESLLYQARRFVGRHRLAVGSAASVLLVVLASAAVALWQAGVAREQARLAHQQEARAVAVQDFLLGLFRANADAQPDPVRARETTARELLDIGAARVRGQLDEAPAAKDAVLSTLAEMYVDVGLNPQAAELAGERVGLREKLHGPDDPRVAEALVDQANWIDSTNDATRGPQLLERARRIADRSGTTDLRLRVMFAQAQVTRYTDVSTSLGFVQEARTLMQRSGVAGDPLRRGLYLEGLNLGFLGACAEGLARLEEAHRISLASEGPKPQWQIPEFTAISSNAICIGDLARAEAALQEALEMSRRLNGPDHVDTTHVLLRLMRVYGDTSRADEARAIEGRLRTLLDDPAVQRDANLNATLLRATALRAWDTGRLDDADTLSARLVQSYRRFTGASVVLAGSLQARARVLAAQGRLDDAARDLDEALTMQRRALGARATPAGLASMRIDRAAVALAAGQAGEALAALDAVAAELPAGTPDARPLLPLLARGRAAALRELGRAAEAAAAARAGLQAMTPPLRPADLPRLRADLLLEQGLALHAMARFADARDLLAQALALRSTNDDATSLWRARVELALAETQWALGDRVAARELGRAARDRLAPVRALGPAFTRPAQRWLR